ncbi:MAG: GyrI-like domain-containing protein [Flavitalea sp.]
MNTYLRLALFAIIGILLAVYILVPSTVTIQETTAFQSSVAATKRFVFQDSNWKYWLRDKNAYDTNYTMHVSNHFYSTIGVQLDNGSDKFETDLLVIPYGSDSTGIDWRDTVHINYNPFTRFSQYSKAVKLQNQMKAVLTQLTAFLNDKQSVYNIKVEREQVRDRPLLSHRVVMQVKPTPEDAYRLIDALRAYAKAQGDTSNEPAMKYTSQIDSVNYELMVAIPTATMLKPTKDYVPKGLVGGNPLFTIVKGGYATIEHAWKAMYQYKDDYQLAAPAIPYEMIINDRRKETDTSKWVTKIVFPTRL